MGKFVYSDGNYRIVEITINQNALSDMFYCEKLDDIGPAFCASLEIIEEAMKSLLGVK